MATDKKAVVAVEKKLYPLVERAKAFVIKSDKDMEEAHTLLSAMKSFYEKAVEQKEKITLPAKAIIKEQDALYKPIETAYKGGIDAMRKIMSTYQTAKVNEAAVEEAKIADRIGPGRGKLSVEKGVEKISEIERPAAVVTNRAGKTQFRPMPKVYIQPLKNVYEGMDFKVLVKAIESGLIVYDEVAVRKATLETKGSDLPGVEYKIEQVPFNSSSY